MSSTPKQQDGDGSVAATGPLPALSPLEQTVMGVAPPPSTRHAAAGAPPAPLEPASIILPSSTIVAVPSAPLPAVEPGGAAPPPSSTIVAAPTIAISRGRQRAGENVAPALTAIGSEAPVAPRPAGDAVHPPPTRQASAPNEAAISATLRIEPSAPAVLAAPPGTPATAHAEPSAQSGRDQTALSADYLREARDTALDQVAQLAPAPSPIALAATERAPFAEAAAAMASALPGSGDTRRSVAPALEPAPESAFASAPIVHGAPTAHGAPGARGFEPVPVVRAPLAESLSSSLGPLAELGGPRHLLPPSSRPRPAPPAVREGGMGRWLLLAAVALVTVGVVSVGGRLWQRYRANSARPRVVASVEASPAVPGSPSGSDATSSPGLASRALLANRPAPEAGGERVRVVSATAGAAPAAAEPGAGATPESQLAATAGRHVLSGNYAEALPLYRQLERSWPENTAYAAMAKLLEKKVGSHNDTRTITPASATPRDRATP